METSERIGLATAAAAPLAGLAGVLRDGRLRRPVLAGLLLSVVVMLAVFGGGVWGAYILIDKGLGDGGSWWTGVLSVFLMIGATGLLIVALPVLFTLLFGIVGGAFLNTVHERAREIAGGRAYTARGVGGEVVVTARSVGWSLRRLLRFLLASAVVAAVAFVPVVGVGALVLEFLVAAYALSWELLTPHFEARGSSYAEQRRFLRRRPGLVLGLGGVGTLLLLVPFTQPLVVFGNQAAAGALSARFDGE